MMVGKAERKTEAPLSHHNRNSIAVARASLGVISDLKTIIKDLQNSEIINYIPMLFYSFPNVEDWWVFKYNGLFYTYTATY